MEMENSKKQKVTSLCVSEKDITESWNLYVDVPRDADEGTYNATILIGLKGYKVGAVKEYSKGVTDEAIRMGQETFGVIRQNLLASIIFNIQKREGDIPFDSSCSCNCRNVPCSME
jgi:hypothetical protein